MDKNVTALFLSLLLISSTSFAEMQSMSDSDLSQVDGQGIGLVMDDFIFSHGHNPAEGKVFKISGVTNSLGQEVSINVNQMYIARAGSNYGSNLEGVNLGRLTNPYEIDLLDGDDIGLAGKAVLEIAAPRKVEDTALGYDCLTGAAGGECSSRPSSSEWVNGERPDIGLELNIQDAGSGLSSNLNFNVESAVFDGSYLRLWGDDDQQRLAAEFRLNFYSPSIEISTCDQTNQGCSSSIKMSNFQMELALGHSFQPLYIGVDSSINEAYSGGLTLEIAKITHQYIDKIDQVTGKPVMAGTGEDPQGRAAYDFFEDYYTNDKYRSDIVVGNLDLGGANLGEQRIEGVLIQYMDVKFKDLDPN